MIMKDVDDGEGEKKKLMEQQDSNKEHGFLDNQEA